MERETELGRGGRRGWKPEMFTEDILSVRAWGPLLGCAESWVLLYAATAHSLAHCLMPGNHLTGMIVTVCTVRTLLSPLTALGEMTLRSPSALIFYDKIMFCVLVMPLQ